MISIAAAGVLVTLGLSAGPRYPADLAIDPSERWLLTANEESSSVSLLDRGSGEVLDELALAPGGRPHAICVSTDEHRGLVTAVAETFVHAVALVSIENASEPAPTRPRLKLLRRLPTGRRPMDVALRSFSEQVLVACEGESELWVHAVDGSAPPRRIPAVEGARRVVILDSLSLSSGQPLVGLAAVAGRTSVAVLGIDSGTRMAVHDPVEGTVRNVGGLLFSNHSLLITHQVQPTESPIEPQTIEWGLIIANRVTEISVDALLEKTARPTIERGFPLDDRGQSSGDPGRSALTSKHVCIAPSGGTDRILFVETRPRGKYYSGSPVAPTLTSYVPIPSLHVGDRPVAVRLTGDEERAYVACSLDDTVVEVDVAERKVLRTLRLGPPPANTAEHRGARIFFDADRSRDGWYSCQSCHPDGGTVGHSFNTQSDGRGLAKRSPALYRIDRTGPWAWLGNFESLEAQVAASLHKTMAVDHPASPGDVEDVIAFLRTIPQPLPLRPGEDLGGDPKNGERLFESAGCSECHAPPDYTTRGLRDIGLEASFDGKRRYNPPSLVGVRDRFRYLHDGRAASLEAVFRDHNPRGHHGKAKELAGSDFRDLIAFLKTL